MSCRPTSGRKPGSTFPPSALAKSWPPRQCQATVFREGRVSDPASRLEQRFVVRPEAAAKNEYTVEGAESGSGTAGRPYQISYSTPASLNAPAKAPRPVSASCWRTRDPRTHVSLPRTPSHCVACRHAKSVERTREHGRAKPSRPHVLTLPSEPTSRELRAPRAEPSRVVSRRLLPHPSRRPEEPPDRRRDRDAALARVRFDAADQLVLTTSCVPRSRSRTEFPMPAIPSPWAAPPSPRPAASQLGDRRSSWACSSSAS